MAATRKTGLEKPLWVAAIACLFCYSAVKLIVDGKFFWAAVPALPLLAYLVIRAPFIFPFGAYAFLIPFDSLLSVTGHETGSTVTKILGILTMLSLLLKGSFEKRFVRADKTVLCWTALSLYAVTSVLWALDPEASLARIPTALGLLAFYLIVSSYQAEKKDWDSLKMALLLGGFFAAVLSIHAYFSGSVFMDSTRATLMLGTRETNPNRLGLSMLIPIALSIEMIFSGKKIDWKKPVYILIMGTLLFCVIISGSRGTMLAVGIIFAVYLLSSRRKFTLALLLIGVSLPLVLFMLQPLLARWRTAYSTGGAGRTYIWQEGVKAFKSFWLAGAGVDNFSAAQIKFADYYPGFGAFSMGSHNTYLQFAVELGIVGFAILLWGFKRNYNLIRSDKNPDTGDRTMLTAAFVAMLGMIFFDDYFWEKSLWILWMMIMIYHNLPNTARAEKKEKASRQ